MQRAILFAWLIAALCFPASATWAIPVAEKDDSSQAEAKTDGTSDKSETEKPRPAKRVNVVRLAIKGSYPEGPTSLGLFGELQQSLATVIQRIDQASEDEDVAALWLRIEGLAVGRGKLHELRTAIAGFRKTGKPVYAELSSAMASQYLLATACDEIVMPPVGTLIVPGVRAEVTFYKGLLDKLGIEFDMLQMGKYKGAAEPFTRTTLSPPLRESLEALTDDAYDDLVGAIAAGRKLEPGNVKKLLDRGLFTATAAREAGLVDQVVYADQFEELLPEKLQADAVDVVTDYKKRKVDTDFSGISGMMRMMELLMGGKPSRSVGRDPKIAVVYAVGPILLGKSTTDVFGETTVGATTLVETLRKAADDPKVVAIVLRIDSPGGSATASDLIWRETVRIEKPIIASMGDVAGSGGYYIAMGADKIFAEPGTLTGSIGVVGGKIVLGGLYDKVGITTEVISRGANSGSFSSTARFTEDERKVWTTLLEEIYRQFVGKAAEGRQIPPERLEELAQGRVYSGRMAEANGLVDCLGTLRDAVAEAKQAAGLEPEAKVELLILPRAKTIFEQLLGDASVSAAVRASAPEALVPLQQAGVLRRLLAEPALLWMPYRLQIR
ncbi:MAG: signal peptide peptidase SppA [Pirellulales bacterium]|nr:signal peptide peptidase SppA [Pirellulales bacterium]